MLANPTTHGVCSETSMINNGCHITQQSITHSVYPFIFHQKKIVVYWIIIKKTA